VDRRKFLAGLMVAPLGAAAVAKSLGDNEKPIMMFSDISKAEFDTSAHITDAYAYLTPHDHALNKWMRERVDEAAFKMMRGDLLGGKV